MEGIIENCIEEATEKISNKKLVYTYSKYKNLHGKISPLVIVFNTYIKELQLMSPKEMATFVVDKITYYNETFREANIRSEVYDYTTNYLKKFEFEMNKKRNTTDALMFFSNAVLKGDGLSTKLKETERQKKDKQKKERYSKDSHKNKK